MQVLVPVDFCNATRERPLTTSHIFWLFWPTYLVLLLKHPFWVLFGPPYLPALISDVINERSSTSIMKLLCTLPLAKSPVMEFWILVSKIKYSIRDIYRICFGIVGFFQVEIKKIVAETFFYHASEFRTPCSAILFCLPCVSRGRESVNFPILLNTKNASALSIFCCIKHFVWSWYMVVVLCNNFLGGIAYLYLFQIIYLVNDRPGKWSHTYIPRMGYLCVAGAVQYISSCKKAS